MADKANVLMLYNYYKSWTPGERALGLAQGHELVEALTHIGHKVRVVEFWKDPTAALESYDPDEWIIFNWVEGIEDEVGGDARVCAILQKLGFTYTGNPPDTLRLSVQKGRVKQVLQRWDIPTPPGGEFARGMDVPDDWSIFPVIVKPVSQHCSTGVNRDAVVHDLDALRARVDYVFGTFGEASLAEAFVAGREINIGVWGNGRPRLLPLREIDFTALKNPFHHMVTWDSKWIATSEDWNVQKVLTEVQATPELRRALDEIVLKTYRAFGCRDYARIDLRIDAQDQPYVIDVNPNPDITSDGGFIGGCKMMGYTYGEAVSRIVEMAVTRRNRRNGLLRMLRQRKTLGAPAGSRQLAVA